MLPFLQQVCEIIMVKCVYLHYPLKALVQHYSPLFLRETKPNRIHWSISEPIGTMYDIFMFYILVVLNTYICKYIYDAYIQVTL